MFIDVEFVVCGGENFRFIDIVYADDLKDLLSAKNKKKP